MVVIIFLAVVLVGSLVWGFSATNAKNDLQKKNTALVVKIDDAKDCIDDWGNLQGYNDYDVFGNSVWVVPNDNFSTITNCNDFMDN